MTQLKKIFQKPSPRSLAQAELEDAQRELLQAQTLLDYSRSKVEYNMARVARLEAHLRAPS